MVKIFKKLIISNWNSIVGKKDTVFHLGDAVYDMNDVDLLSQLNGKKILIIGNYDEKNLDILEKYFMEIHINLILDNVKEIGSICLNHYPEKAPTNFFNIVGHIHSLWKVQKNMINVGCDAWNMKPISIDKIIYIYNAIKNHYDANVFAGSLKNNFETL